ncbi:MAG: aromatic ring-hydroxylating dioxygenase subunit alpha [Spirochaetota bacterium]
MIRDQWYAVLESKEVPKGKPVAFLRMGEKLVFWRSSDGAVHCFLDKCAHRGVQLSVGIVIKDVIRCPFHGLEYDVSGKCTVIPANGRTAPVPSNFRMKAYATAESMGFIWIFWGERTDRLPPLPAFDDLTDDFTYVTVKDYWDTHYSRAIENQLDAPHVPFVHHNTIGRGNRTTMDGPLVEWVGKDKFFVYAHMHREDGTLAIKPDKMKKPNVPFKLEFAFPNVWQNHIAESVRVLVAFAPVDDVHTILYLRFYQKFMKAPLLRKWFAWLAMPFNITVAHQDRRVVVTQQPKASGLSIGENLFPGDGPIIAYRRRRDELMEGK